MFITISVKVVRINPICNTKFNCVDNGMMFCAKQEESSEKDREIKISMNGKKH